MGSDDRRVRSGEIVLMTEHAEVFESSRTGDSIRVRCECPRRTDHLFVVAEAMFGALPQTSAEPSTPVAEAR
jgi:hypothetical protein